MKYGFQIVDQQMQRNGWQPKYDKMLLYILLVTPPHGHGLIENLYEKQILLSI